MKLALLEAIREIPRSHFNMCVKTLSSFDKMTTIMRLHLLPQLKDTYCLIYDLSELSGFIATLLISTR